MQQERRMYRDLKDELLLTKEQIAARVRDMGEEITRDYDGMEGELVLVGILKGAIVFFADLIREIDLPLSMDFMAISSYGSATKSSGVVRIPRIWTRTSSESTCWSWRTSSTAA